MKKILILVVLLAVAYFGLTLSGYAFYPQNFKYYVPKPAGKNLAEVTFHNGTTFAGEITLDAVDSIQLNMDGSKMTFRKSEIASIKELESSFLGNYIENVKRHSRIHPIIGKDKKKLRQQAANIQGQGAKKDLVSQLTGAGHLDQMNKMKDKIGEIDKIAQQRNQQIEALMNNGLDGLSE